MYNVNFKVFTIQCKFYLGIVFTQSIRTIYVRNSSRRFFMEFHLRLGGCGVIGGGLKRCYHYLCIQSDCARSCSSYQRGGRRPSTSSGHAATLSLISEFSSHHITYTSQPQGPTSPSSWLPLRWCAYLSAVL